MSASATSTPPKRRPPPTLSQSTAAPTPPSCCSPAPLPLPLRAGAEAIRQAEREGLTLAASSSSSTGYKGVTFCPKQKGSKKYRLEVTVGGKRLHLGYFATAEEAALFYARREAGMDTLASDLTAPPPPPPPSSTSAELPVYELSILTPEQMAANTTYSPPSNFDYSRARRRGVWRPGQP